MTLQLEFTVEPFVEGAPGPHVQAAVSAAEAAGLTVEFGPFGTAVSGDDDSVLGAIEPIVQAAIGAGATRVSLQLARPD
jgi:uncharacterized protein YqgV (UPF0045/DUF77 family)